jgi:8-oxo-dGTP pyrophosphatase MutT (NUDIX family)
MGKLPTRLETSAGGVVVRHGPQGEVEVALIRPRGDKRWALPKGWVEVDESPQDAALREVREETGVTARVVESLERIEYWFRTRQGASLILVHKYVDFFLMAALEGDLADHDHEVEEARWFTLDQAIEVAAFKSERQVLEKARARLTPGLRPGSSSSPHSETAGS